jgi:hypothetical protein
VGCVTHLQRAVSVKRAAAGGTCRQLPARLDGLAAHSPLRANDRIEPLGAMRHAGRNFNRPNTLDCRLLRDVRQRATGVARR